MTFSQITVKSDLIGMLASGLCLLHCMATPFLFMANTGLGIHSDLRPSWWGYLEPFFLVLSFFAVYWSITNTTQKWIKYCFGFFWTFLLLLVLNEKFGLWHVQEEVIYVPAIGLILLHFYNRRFCHCEDESCCAENK